VNGRRLDDLRPVFSFLELPDFDPVTLVAQAGR
jgi:hypothetical protein